MIILLAGAFALWVCCTDPVPAGPYASGGDGATGRGMDFETIDSLRDRNPAWRLLRAGNAALVLSFLSLHFVERNQGATSASSMASLLDDTLYALNVDPEQPRFPRTPMEYLDDWADAGWVRRFYPQGSDEVHFDALPAFERAYAWVRGLGARSFVGTESRLQAVIELLRQIVHGTESDPQARLAELHRRRAELDREIEAVEAGDLSMLDATALRDRYQLFASTARDLLSDFREVEENLRGLDRTARERIALWGGSKGDLLTELVGSRADIASSDQGRSFQSFYDFLLSETRQDELSTLLARVEELPELDTDRRLRTVHYDWSEAAERTQQTVRQISEQLRRFLDDQVWLENRRVLDLAREIEAAALACRDAPPSQLHLECDEPGVMIALPFERPIYDARPPTPVDSLLDPEAPDEVDVTALLAQAFVDPARLAGNVRSVVPVRSSALLTDIIGEFPLHHGTAELVGYLALADDDLEVVMDESEESVLDLHDGDLVRRVRLPKVTVNRR